MQSTPRPSRSPRLRRGAAPALLGLSLTVVLVACGGTDPEGGGGGAGGAGLTLTGNTDQKAALDPIIAAFEAENPGTTIDVSYAPVDQLQTALRAQIGAGNAPDVYVAWPGNGSAMSTAQLSSAGAMEPLTDQAWVESVPESLRRLLGDGQDTLMWSPGVGVIGVIYNKDIFSEQGITEPTTWPEFLAACEALKAAGVTPLALGNQTPWVTQLINYAIAPSVAFADDPDLATRMLEGEATFSDSGWRDTFQRYLELNERGYFQENPNGTTFEQAISLTAEGEAAMMVQVSTILPQVADAAAGRAEFGMFPLPAADTAEALKIPAGISSGYAVSPDSDNLEEAKAFIEFLGQPENTAAFAEATAIIPFGVDDPSTVEESLQPFVPYIAEDRSVPYMDQEWPNAQVQPAHFAVVQELFAGSTDIDGALAQLDAAYAEGS